MAVCSNLSSRPCWARVCLITFSSETSGLREFDKSIVGSKEEYERMQANRKNVLDFAEEAVLDQK